jgi:hypothetical protein
VGKQVGDVLVGSCGASKLQDQGGLHQHNQGVVQHSGVTKGIHSQPVHLLKLGHRL